MKIEMTSAARADLEEARLYCEEQRKGLGVEFDSEIKQAIERIFNFPKRGRARRHEPAGPAQSVSLLASFINSAAI